MPFLLGARHPQLLSLLCALDGLHTKLQTPVFSEKEETSVCTVYAQGTLAPECVSACLVLGYHTVFCPADICYADFRDRQAS